MFLNSALKYLEKGCSVIPVNKDTKKPYIAWAEFQTRYATKDEIEKWAKDFPDAAIGLVCGRISDLTVIDCDTPEAVELIESLLPEGLECPVAQTPRGGRHYFFKYCPELTSVNRVREAIDVKSEGGYVIASFLM